MIWKKVFFNLSIVQYYSLFEEHYHPAQDVSPPTPTDSPVFIISNSSIISINLANCSRLWSPGAHNTTTMQKFQRRQCHSRCLQSSALLLEQQQLHSTMVTTPRSNQRGNATH